MYLKNDDIKRIWSSFYALWSDFLEYERPRLPNFIPVLIGTGIWLYFSLQNEPNFLLNMCMAMCSVGAVLYWKKDIIVGIIALICLGFFSAQLRTVMVDTTMLEEKTGKIIQLYATVESCEKTERGLIFTLNDIEPLHLKKIQLVWNGAKAKNCKQDYEHGMRIKVRACLLPLYGQSFPGAYDFKLQQYFRGISARGYIAKQPTILRVPNMRRPVFTIESLRHSINRKIEEVLPPDEAAVSQALITGNKHGISKQIRKAFSDSGTAHLLAISGLHMGIIGFFIFWLFRIILCLIPPIALYHDVKKVSAVLSLPLLLFYLLLSGHSVPSIRAYIMHMLIMVGILMSRKGLTMRSICIAALFILLVTPEVLMFPGFQMSFGAVIAIVAFYEKYEKLEQHPIMAIVMTTMLASLPVALFSVSNFNQLTLNSMFANVLAIPLMSFFIMPIAMISLLFMLLDWVTFPMHALGFGVKLLIKIVKFAATLPGSYIVMPTPEPYVMAILIYSGLWLALVHHKVRHLGFAGIAVGLMCYYFQPLPDLFISPGGKAIGFRTPDAVCFNSRRPFRSMATTWAKSVGFDSRKKWTSSKCSEFITQESDYQYTFTKKDKDYQIDISQYMDSDYAHIIYLPTMRAVSNEKRNRPWS